MLERDLRETFFTELSKYINKKNITNGEFVRIFTYPNISYSSKRKKELKKRHPGLKLKSTYVVVIAFFSLGEKESATLRKFPNSWTNKPVVNINLSGKGKSTKKISRLVHLFA